MIRSTMPMEWVGATTAGAGAGAGAGAAASGSRTSRTGAGRSWRTLVTAGFGMLRLALLSACTGSLRCVPRW